MPLSCLMRPLKHSKMTDTHLHHQLLRLHTIHTATKNTHLQIVPEHQHQDTHLQTVPEHQLQDTLLIEIHNLHLQDQIKAHLNGENEFTRKYFVEIKVGNTFLKRSD